MKRDWMKIFNYIGLGLMGVFIILSFVLNYAFLIVIGISVFMAIINIIIADYKKDEKLEELEKELRNLKEGSRK